MDRTKWKCDGGRVALIAGAIGTAIMAGCKPPANVMGSHTSASAVVTNPTTTSPVAPGAPPAPVAMVDYSDKGCHFQYSNSWKPKTDKEFELHLIPASGEANRDITFDIPDLPWHLPGMITLGRIEGGYVDDLKKQHAGLKIDSSADHALPDGAKARLVESSWKQGDTIHSDVGLLIMRNDHVYILSCNADARNLPATRADFDKACATLHWDK